MIRILQIMSTLDCGGAENMIMQLYRNIDRRKIQFDFIVHKRGKCFFEDEVEKLGGHVYRLPRYNLLNHFLYKHKLKIFFKEHTEYKIAHLHIRSIASIIIGVAKKINIITISHSHSTSNGKGIKSIVKKIFQRNIRKKADFLLACSKESAEWLFGNKITKSNNCIILNNAIDTEKYIYDTKIRNVVRKEFKIDENDIVVGHVGRFAEMKNHKFLIEIFEELHKKDERYKLLLVGSGTLEEEIKLMVEKLGLSEYVTFAGVRNDVNNILQAMDIFVMPSIYEGLPVTLVEAQAANLPCLITDNISEEVNITNLVYRESLNNNSLIWANKIMDISSKSNRENYKNVIDKIKKSGYDIATTTEKLSNLYFKLLEEK